MTTTLPSACYFDTCLDMLSRPLPAIMFPSISVFFQFTHTPSARFTSLSPSGMHPSVPTLMRQNCTLPACFKCSVFKDARPRELSYTVFVSFRVCSCTAPTTSSIRDRLILPPCFSLQVSRLAPPRWNYPAAVLFHFLLPGDLSFGADLNNARVC